MAGLAGALLVLACSDRVQAATPNMTMDSFSSGGQLGNWYGYDTPVFASGVHDGTSGDAGSAYFYNDISMGANVVTSFDCIGGGNPWYAPASFDASVYTEFQFDLKWDNTSTLTPQQFNYGTNWQTALFNASDSWAPQNYMQQGGWTTGVELDLIGPGNSDVYMANLVVPAAATVGWTTITVPIPTASAGAIGSVNGIMFKKWAGNNTWSINARTDTGSFWIDNIVFIGNTTPIPNPTVVGPILSTPGLNIFNASVGAGPNYYNRNDVISTTTSGLSWAGPGATYPVAYSFVMGGFPTGGAYTGNAYMLLIPNSGAEDNAPDWNESSVAYLSIQSTGVGTGQAAFQYKVNDPGSEETTVPFTSISPANPSQGTNLNSVETAQILGTYTLTFTSADNYTVTVPDGSVGSGSLPAGTGTTYFAEGVTEPVPSGDPVQGDNYNFLIYLGGQANSVNFINQAFVYDSFTVTGAAASGTGTDPSENFLTDANTSTALQHWSSSVSTTPGANLLVPSSAKYWIGWTVPATGFGLDDTASLDAPIQWNEVTTYPMIGMYGTNYQLVAAADLESPSGINQYFGLVKRSYNATTGSLLIAFPGQTFVQGTGIVGSPTAINNTLGANNEPGVWSPSGPVYVYAVDASLHLVNGVTDVISMYSNPTMGAGFDQITNDFTFNNVAGGSFGTTMAAGVATFNNSSASDMYWGSQTLFSGPGPYLTLSGVSNYMVQVVDYTLQVQAND